MSGRPPLRLLVITGPTATGKTRLGVDVAHALGSEIVSADSRQVYRGLDIGSGKDLDEYRRVTPPVPYHLIDVADPRTPYSLALYQQACHAVLADAARREPFAGGTPLVMVGGSGLYVEAILRGYRIANVPADHELRARLMRRPKQELIDELRAANPALAAATDTTSHKRVVRALEIAAATGEGPVERSAPAPVRLEHRVFVVDLPRDELHARIDARLDARLAEGLIDEARRLVRDGLSLERMEQLGLEYREAALHLAGAKDLEQMLADLRRGIRRFAKRQRTWFRGFARRGIDATWIAPDDVEAVLAAAGRDQSEGS